MNVIIMVKISCLSEFVTIAARSSAGVVNLRLGDLVEQQ
jgi:hypothetical protein